MLSEYYIVANISKQHTKDGLEQSLLLRVNASGGCSTMCRNCFLTALFSVVYGVINW